MATRVVPTNRIALLSAFQMLMVSATVSGQILNESAKLLPADGAANDIFGGSASVSGDVAVVSAAYDDDNGTDSGSAYVFRWNPGAPGSWVQEQKFLASDGAAGDAFGGHVSNSGDVAILGAHSHGHNGPWSGSAYVFRYYALGSPCGEEWCEEQELLASDGSSNDWFGYSVSISGDVAVVGTLQEYGGAGPTAVYVFRYYASGSPCGKKWCEEQKLQPSDGAEYGLFGFVACVSGDVAVVGARWDDVKGTDSGSAFVYRWNGSSWIQEQKLLASDGAANDWFGGAVSVSGDVAVVGADLHDHPNGTDSGSAYVFRYYASGSPCGEKWCEEQELLASDGTPGDEFAWSVSVFGDVIVVGAGLDDDNGDESGSAYMFRRDGSSWVERHKLLASDGAVGDWFGVPVSVSGDMTVVGALRNDDNGPLSGSAYIFQHECDVPCAPVAARSCKDHAGSRFCLDTDDGNDPEPRQGGITDVEIDLDTAAGFEGSASVDCATPWSGSVNTAVDQNTVTLTFDPALPDEAACTITLDCGAAVCARGLAGDADLDGVVTVVDNAATKLRFGMTVDQSTARFDFNRDGDISPVDNSQRKLRFGNYAPACP